MYGKAQLRQMWNFFIDPMLTNDKAWSDDEFMVIFICKSILDLKWKLIAQSIKGRTNQKIAQKWHPKCVFAKKAQLKFDQLYEQMRQQMPETENDKNQKLLGKYNSSIVFQIYNEKVEILNQEYEQAIIKKLERNIELSKNGDITARAVSTYMLNNESVTFLENMRLIF